MGSPEIFERSSRFPNRFLIQFGDVPYKKCQRKKVDNVLVTGEIGSFGLRAEAVDSRLSYAVLNPLAA